MIPADYVLFMFNRDMLHDLRGKSHDVGGDSKQQVTVKAEERKEEWYCRC